MTDREKVVKALQNCSVQNDVGCQCCPYFEERKTYGHEWCTTSMAQDTLALLKEQEAVKQKWTSVKERYPDKEGFYLVSADHGNYLPWIAEMKIFCGVKGFCNGAAMPCVGAWMPLPEPYNRTD